MLWGKQRKRVAVVMEEKRIRGWGYIDGFLNGKAKFGKIIGNGEFVLFGIGDLYQPRQLGINILDLKVGYHQWDLERV